MIYNPRKSSHLKSNDELGVTRLIIGRVRVDGNNGGIVQLVLNLSQGLHQEFRRLLSFLTDCDLELRRADLELLERRVRVDRSAERLHVFRADLREVLHRLEVLTTHVTDALKSSVGKRHEVLAALLGLSLGLGLLLLLVDFAFVLQFVYGVDWFGLE